MATVEPGSTRWKQLVASCRKKDAAALWAIGDAALEIAPIGTARGNQYGGGGIDDLPTSVEEKLTKFAAEIERSLDRVKILRRVAAAFPAGRRVEGASVSVHEVLMSPQHRRKVRPGMTVNQAQDKAGITRNTRRTAAEIEQDRAESIAAQRRRERDLDEMYPDRLTNDADIKAVKASNREALQPLVDTLANMKVVGAIYAAAEAIRAATPDEALMAEIDEALNDVTLARHEIDFRRANA